MKNLLPNSSFGICTAMPLRRIGAPIIITGWQSNAAGNVILNTSQSVDGHCEGLVPGKLVLIEGSGTPHAPHIELVADGQTPDSSTQRIYGPVGSFTGLEVGDIADITGGTNTMSRGKYRITATDANRYIDFFYPVAPVETEKTYNITYYEGSKDVRQELNGMPQAGAPETPSAIGYPLTVTECNAGSFVCSLPGDVAAPGASGTARAWEVTPGIFANNNGAGPDGWCKSTSAEVYREYLKDIDGVTSVIKNGENFGVNFTSRASLGNEYYYCPKILSSNAELLTEYKGKGIVFGAYAKVGATNHARLVIDDGVTITYSPYFTAGSFEWKEITAIISLNATYLTIGWEFTSFPGTVSHLTQPMMRFGAYLGEGNYERTKGIHNFTTHPNMHRKFVNGSVGASQNIRYAQESLGALPRGLLKGIFIGVEAHNSSTDSASWIRVSDRLGLAIPSLTMYSQVAGKVIVNSGYAVTGRQAEGYPSSFVNDVISFEVGNATWSGINIDMFACVVE